MELLFFSYRFVIMDVNLLKQKIHEINHLPEVTEIKTLLDPFKVLRS
jgi:hypothetical protein